MFAPPTDPTSSQLRVFAATSLLVVAPPRTSEKWRLTPILLAVPLLGILVVLGSSGAVPSIYTLF